MLPKQKTFQPPDTSRIEQLAGTPLASFTRRGIALFIDFFSAGVIFIILAVSVFKFGDWTGLYEVDPDLHIDFVFFENWYSLIWLVLYFTLSIYFSNGKTLGKLICRIRILSLVHERINLWHSFERSLGYGASTLEFGFGFIQYFIRPDRRTIHDRIAETIVIAETPRKRKKRKPEEPELDRSNEQNTAG